MQNLQTPDFKWHERILSPKYFLYWGLAISLLLLAIFVGVSPILFGAGLLLLVVILLYLRAPAWALYSTIFINLLPQGLPPDAIQSAGALALLSISVIFWLLQTGFQRRKLIWTAPVLFVLGFLLWSFITLLWAPDLVIGRQALVQYTIVIIIAFLMINQVDSLQALNGLMNALALSGWVLVVIGLWTVLFGGYSLGDRLQIYDMNENLLGPLLMLTTAGVVWQAMHAAAPRKRFWMLLSVLYIIFSLGLIALSGSRGSFIGFLLVLIMFATTRSTRPWARWGAVIGVVGIVCAPFIFTTVLDRFTNDSEDLYGDRDVLWQSGLLVLNDYPWTGVGIGNGPYVMLDYVNRVSDTDHIGHFATRPAHNPILEVADDTGLIGVVLYLCTFASALWLFLRQFYYAVRRRADLLSTYCSLVFCVSIGFLSAWLKSGGLADHVTIFILLVLWVIPYRIQVATNAQQNSSEGKNLYGSAELLSI